MDSRGVSQHTVQDLMRAQKPNSSAPFLIFNRVKDRRDRINQWLRQALKFEATVEGDYTAWTDPQRLLEFLSAQVYKDQETLEVSIGFDGRSLFKHCDNVLLCARILQVDGRRQHRRCHVWPLAILPVKESYECLGASALKDVLQRLNFTSVRDGKVKVRFWFCSDMKAALMALGLVRAGADCSCFICKCTTRQRQSADARSYKNIRTHTDGQGEGQVRENWLLAFERHCIIFDTLHLLLRSFDNLLAQTVHRFIEYELPYVHQQDPCGRLQRRRKSNGQTHIERFFNSSFFTKTFYTWSGVKPFFLASRDSAKFQSLPGGKIKRFFERCDWSKMFITHKTLGEAIQLRWSTFYKLYSTICTLSADTDDAQLSAKATELLTFASSLTSSVTVPIESGATKTINVFDANVHTPYMHIFCFHSIQIIHNIKARLPSQSQPHFSLNSFSCQSLENSNKGDIVYAHNAVKKDKKTMNQDMMLAHYRRNLNPAQVSSVSKTKRCAQCGMLFERWGWLKKHCVDEHNVELGDIESRKVEWEKSQRALLETLQSEHQHFCSLVHFSGDQQQQTVSQQ